MTPGEITIICFEKALTKTQAEKRPFRSPAQISKYMFKKYSNADTLHAKTSREQPKSGHRAKFKQRKVL